MGGKASAGEWTKAIAKAIDMGASMDPKLLQAGVYAHHEAIISVDGKLVTSLEDYEKVVAALGRMIASVPEAKTMAVYDDFGKLVDPAVPKFLMATVKEADAQAAYKALLEFKDVVKANPIKATAAAPVASSKIDAAAGRLADASYPFLKDIDWSSPLAAKMSGFSGVTLDALKAVDSALLTGYSTNMGALKEAADAHVKAIGSMDANGLTTKADYQAILAGLGKVVATANDRSAFEEATSAVIHSGIFPIWTPPRLICKDCVQWGIHPRACSRTFSRFWFEEGLPASVSHHCTKYRSCIVGEVKTEADGRRSTLAPFFRRLT